VQTEFLALKGLERMIATMALMRSSQQRDYAFTIIPTMYDKRTRASLEAYKELKVKYQDKVWSAVVPVDTKFRDASVAQTPPNVFAPSSRGVFAYNTLLTYLLQLAPEA
jgi:chromosome partitioning protein